MNLTSPKNWKTVKLGELAEIRRGSSPRPIQDFLSQVGMSWVKISDATADETRYIHSTKQFIKEEGIKNTVIVNEGDFIVSNSATPGLPKFMKITAGVHDGWLIIKPDESKINKLFLYYQMIYDRPRLVGQASGAVFDNLKTDTLKDHEFLLPSIEEQKEIAAILGSLDDKIELLRRENKTLESIAQTLFRKWFVEFRFPRYEGVKIVDGVPEGWKAGNIYDLMKIQYGFPFKSEFFNENKNGLPLIRIRDLKDGDPSIYTNEVCGEEYIIKRGDIVAGMDAEFRPCIWKGENGVLNQRVCKFISKDESISNYFIYQVIKPHLEFFERTKGGTTVSHLGKADLDSIELIIPPKDLLISFSNSIDSSYKKLINNFSEIQTLSKLRDDLLNKIFNV